MRVICIWVLLGLVAFASGQVVVPEKGWLKIGKGEGKVEGMEKLGVWGNDDKTKGDVMVGAALGHKMPEKRVLLDLPPGGVEDGALIEGAVMLEKPRLGLMIQFSGKKLILGGQRMRNYWIYGKDGGAFLQAIHDKDARFDLKGWGAQGVPEDEDGRKRKELEKLVKMINAIEAVPTIKIDGNLRPPEGMGQEALTAITVEILKDGSFRVGGKLVEREDLVGLMKMATEKIPGGVLKIKADKRTEFKFIQRVIKAGIAAGIEKLAYGLLTQKGAEDEE